MYSYRYQCLDVGRRIHNNVDLSLSTSSSIAPPDLLPSFPAETIVEIIMDSPNKSPSSSGDSSPLKQHMLKRNSLFGDELLNFDPGEIDGDDWRDVFDDPSSDSMMRSGQQQASGGPQEGSASADGGDDSDDEARSNSAAAASAPSSSTKDEAPNQPGTKSSSGRGSDSKDDGEEFSSSIQQSAFADPSKGPPWTSVGDDSDDEDKNGSESSTETSAWQNPEIDKPFREKMMQDIAQLLFTRKETKNPDEKWIARVKAQARAFESQLYKNAASLEAYTDITTLMRRIAKLADAFAHHFRQAKKRHSKRNSTSSATSMSSLGSLGDHFSNVELRRSSAGSLASGGAGLQKDRLSTMSLPASSSSASTNSIGPSMNNLVRAQSDSFIPNAASNLHRTSSGGVSTMPTAILGGNINNMNNPMGNNLGTLGMQQQQQQPQNNQQLQQQLLANIQQQQQRLLAQQMNMGGGQMGSGGNNPMMAAQAAAMMGNNGMAMFNQMQQQQQQQTNSMNMNMNMMQQQQNLLRQQQNTMGMNMMQNPNATMMMGNNGMNMMNINLQSVIPGPNGGIGNMQGMVMGNNSGMGSRDSMTMPPPGMLNAAGMNRQQSGPNDDSSNSMSPGSFHW